MILQYIKATGLILDTSNRPVAKVLDDTGLSPAERDYYGKLFERSPYLEEFCKVEERRRLLLLREREAGRRSDGNGEDTE